MAENTSIEWADHTFNPWIGCTKVGPGCDNCYASAWDRRFAVSGHAMHWGAGQARRRIKTWGDPIRWNKQHEAFFVAHGRRQRVFCASLADVFDNEVPSEWRVDLLRLIAETPNLDWLLLTKRIGNAHQMMTEAFRSGWPTHDTMWERWGELFNHVWIGATICSQEEANRDIPKLLAVPAAKRFLSMEPLLGPVDLRLKLTTVEERLRVQRELARTPGEFQRMSSRGELLHWVIVGFESGPRARPGHPDHARSLRDQCQAAGVAFMFKQWGEWGPDWEGAMTCAGCGDTKFDSCSSHDECARCGETDWQDAEKPLDGLRKVGKKAAGRHLDGRTWDEVPA